MQAPNASALQGITSMATRALLTELFALYQSRTGTAMQLTAVGGVDAAKRVEAGESFDMVFLASDALNRLVQAGHVSAKERVDWVSASVAVAVPANAPHPRIGDASELKQAVLAARKLGYSTGPSGQYLEGLFRAWGLQDVIAPKVVIPPPGTPVAALLAQGEIDLGFQQRSELVNQPGIALLGDLPDEVAYTTVFGAAMSAAVALQPERAQAVASFFSFLVWPEHQALKAQMGMA